ncbi:MAG: hypothetical protein MUF54_24755 [Polyangiaceae bacterium]|jgi:hypothetical protein|nr:hypothetical protein [Polyangiaceae bacterium]
MPASFGEGIVINSARSLGSYPAARPLTGDQATEFHAARLLLPLHLGSAKTSIDDLTKLAKLDFFVRYPEFFSRASTHLGKARAN